MNVFFFSTSFQLALNHLFGSFKMALSAASPFYRGYVSDIDCRWGVISASVDDRTQEERGLKVSGRATAWIRFKPCHLLGCALFHFTTPWLFFFFLQVFILSLTCGKNIYFDIYFSMQPLKNNKYRIFKSRYDSIDSYLSSCGEKYNDIDLTIDKEINEQLLSGGTVI